MHLIRTRVKEDMEEIPMRSMQKMSQKVAAGQKKAD